MSVLSSFLRLVGGRRSLSSTGVVSSASSAQDYLNKGYSSISSYPTTDAISNFFNPTTYQGNVAKWQAQQDYYKTLANWYREDTAYQRAVSDLKAAGLNPALLYGSAGTAASSGAVSSALPMAVDSSKGINTVINLGANVFATLVKSALQIALRV